MADVNKSVSINYTASTEGLEKALKRIPNITDAQANKAAQEIDKNFKKMESSAEKTSKNISSKMKTIGKSFAIVGASASAAIAGVIALSQKFADLTNELVDASTKTGIAVETLAGLRLAAEGSGLAFANLEGGLIKFQGSILDAARGSKNLQMTFGQLGVSIKDSNGELRDSNSVFLDSIKALSSMENLTERNALAMQLFGRQSGPALIQSGALDNLEGMTTLAREFGIAINESAIGSMGDFQRKMAEFGTVFDGTMQKTINSIAGPNSLNAAIQGASDLMIYFGSIAQDIMRVVGEGFESVFTIGAASMLMFEGKTAQALELMQTQSEETKQSVYNLGDIFSRASAEVDRFNELSSSSTAPKVMADVEEATISAIESVSNLNEEMKTLEETTSDLFDETGDLMEKSFGLWEKSNSFVNESLLDKYELQKDKIKEIGQELRSHIMHLETIKESREEELRLLEAQNEGVNQDSGDLTEQQIKDFERIAELKGNILFLTNEIDSMEGQYVSQRLAEYTELNNLRLEQIDEQKEAELSAQEAIRASYMENFGLFEEFNSRIFDLYGSIVDAVEAKNNAEISSIQDKMDAEIEAIDKREASEVISKEESARLKEQIEAKYNQQINERELKSFKARQALAVSEVIFQGAIAAARAIADYGIPAGLVMAGLSAAQTGFQLAAIKSESPPKFDVGGMVGNSTDSAPDMVRANLLKGEAILDRSTVQRIGGEEGVRALQNGQNMNNKPIIIQPFKHIDRYSRVVNKRTSRRVGSGVY